jgi:hypothetical protein
LPDAPRGPGYSTLVGHDLLAANARGDIRDIGRITRARAPRGMVGRFIAAMKGGY